MCLRSKNRCGRAVPVTTLTFSLFLSIVGSRNAVAEGPFSAMGGTWSGPGTITVNGNKERLRCRANYDVKNAGSTFDLNIRCASDSYKFDLAGGVNYVNGAVTGSWSESAHGAAGSISGTVSGGVIRVSAAGPYFSALLSMNTRGSTQSISLNSPGSQISSVTINLSKGGATAAR